MRSMIEISVYLLVMTLMCFISLDLILMNADMTRKQETIDYIRDYVEIYGSSEENSIEGGAEYVLNEKILTFVNQTAKAANMTVGVEYEESTEHYRYYRMNVSYPLKSGIMGIKSTQSSSCLIRTQMG